MTQYVVKIDFNSNLTCFTARTLEDAVAAAKKVLEEGATEAVIERHTSERVMVITRKEEDDETR